MKKSDYTPIHRLANAIIEQACIDYLDAKHHLKTVSYKNKQNQVSAVGKYKRFLIEVPSFLTSEYFKTLTDIDGKDLLQMLEKKYILEVIESALKVANYCATTSCDDCVFTMECGKYHQCVLTESSPIEEIETLNTIYKGVKKHYGKTNSSDTTK